MRKLKSIILSLIIVLGISILAGCGEPPPPPEESVDWNNNSIIEEWEEKFEAVARPNNRNDLIDDLLEQHNLENYTTISTLTEFKAINENYNTETTTIYFLTNDIDCQNEIIHISLRNNIIFGNNYVITNFRLEKPNGGDAVSLFDGDKTAKIYDLRVYGRLQTLPIDASNPSITRNYASFFNNIHTLDNITTKGGFNLVRTKELGDSTKYNVDATLMAMNCKYINKCTAIGIINYEETPGNATGIKQFAGIDISNGTSKSESDAYISNCTNKVIMNIYSESTTNIGGITINSYGKLLKNVVDISSHINVSTYDTVAESEEYVNKVAVSGICLNSYEMANIKNNIFSGTINAEVKLTEFDVVPYAYINASAITKNATGSIFTFNQAKGNINIKNFKSVNVGGFTCSAKNSLFHYNTCTTDISVDNAQSVTTAQFATNLEHGLVEYLLMDTDIYVNAPYPDARINTAVFSLMRTESGEEKAMPNLYKILFMGNTSFRLPASNENLHITNGVLADNTKYQPMMYSRRLLYYTDSYTIKRLTPTDGGEDQSTSLLENLKSNLENTIAGISNATVNYSWLFSTGLAFNSNYTGIDSGTSGVMSIENVYFKNISDANYHEEQVNANILEGVRFDYYLDKTYTANKNDELYCVLASNLQYREPMTIAFSETYFNDLMTKFETQSKIEALEKVLEDIIDVKEIITKSKYYCNTLVNEAGIPIGLEVKIESDTTKIIKIDTQMIEDNVNFITLVITEVISMPNE